MTREGKPPAFQFYPADWLSDSHVLSMTLEEEGAYIRLLCVCWREGSIPTDTPSLARLLKTSELVASSIWAAVGPCFNQDGTHPRLLLERAKQAAYRKGQSDRATTRQRILRQNKELARPASYQLASAGKQSASASASASSLKEAPKVNEHRGSAPAQTPPEVVKVKAIPRDDPLSPDERHAMTTAGLVIKAIERLELGQNGDRFQPGQWWGHSRKEKRRVVPMLATLEQLRRRLEAKDRPASPWAYCEATYEEKRASYWADHAEREQAARKKEPAAPIVAELLSAAGAVGSKIGGG